MYLISHLTPGSSKGVSGVTTTSLNVGATRAGARNPPDRAR